MQFDDLFLCLFCGKPQQIEYLIRPIFSLVKVLIADVFGCQETVYMQHVNSVCRNHVADTCVPLSRFPSRQLVSWLSTLFRDYCKLHARLHSRLSVHFSCNLWRFVVTSWDSIGRVEKKCGAYRTPTSILICLIHETCTHIFTQTYACSHTCTHTHTHTHTYTHTHTHTHTYTHTHTHTHTHTQMHSFSYASIRWGGCTKFICRSSIIFLKVLIWHQQHAGVADNDGREIAPIGTERSAATSLISLYKSV